MHLDLAPSSWEFLVEANRFESVMQNKNPNILQVVVSPIRLPLANRRMKRATDNYLSDVRSIHPGMQFGVSADIESLKMQANKMIMPTAAEVIKVG